MAKGDAAASSKAVVGGFVIEMSHSNGKGCLGHTDNSKAGYATLCDQAKPTVFFVVDAGNGYIALAEGREPFSGVLRSRPLSRRKPSCHLTITCTHRKAAVHCHVQTH